MSNKPEIKEISKLIVNGIEEGYNVEFADGFVVGVMTTDERSPFNTEDDARAEAIRVYKATKDQAEAPTHEIVDEAPTTDEDAK